MLAEQTAGIEHALWIALKTLDENANLSHRMAKQAQQSGHDWLAERFNVRVKEAEQHATLLRQVLTGMKAIDQGDTNAIL